MSGELTKVCTSCGRELPLTAYYKDGRQKSGRYSECRDCTKARRQRDRAGAREAEARYRAAHRAELARKAAERRAADPESERRKQAKSRARKRERARETSGDNDQ